MSLQLYLAGLMFSTFLCWISFILVLFYVNPQEAGLIGFGAFYLSLFFALVGTFSLIGFYLRIWFSRNEIIYKHIFPAFRQGFFLALIFVVTLILQAFRILTWWDGLLLVGSIVLLELYFASRQISV